jgi:hydroxypyruvate isomerase
MLAFAANLSTLFTDRPFLERFACARAAGFTAVECQFPYAHSTQDLCTALNANGLRMVLHNLPAGNWAEGERGIACHPNRIDEFRSSVFQAVAYAKALQVPQLHCMAGITPAGVPTALAQQTLLSNLQFAARTLQAQGLRLLLEPLNTLDLPGYFLSHADPALELIEHIGCDNVFLQYDLYHAHRMHDDIVQTLTQHLARIGHIQLADSPGRAEPGTGAIPFEALFELLESLHYRGHIGCEYFPQDPGVGGTEKGLSWLARHGRNPTGQRIRHASPHSAPH